MSLSVQRLGLWAASGKNRLQDIRQGCCSGELVTFEGQAVFSAEDYPSVRCLPSTYSYPFFFSLLCVIAQAVIPPRVSPCGICGGQSATGTGFPPSTSVPPCQYHSTAASPYAFNISSTLLNLSINSFVKIRIVSLLFSLLSRFLILSPL